jgi:hypothetical protein
MPGKGIALSCPNCGGNRLAFPQTDAGQVTCQESGSGFVYGVGQGIGRLERPPKNQTRSPSGTDRPIARQGTHPRRLCDTPECCAKENEGRWMIFASRYLQCKSTDPIG